MSTPVTPPLPPVPPVPVGGNPTPTPTPIAGPVAPPPAPPAPPVPPPVSAPTAAAQAAAAGQAVVGDLHQTAADFKAEYAAASAKTKADFAQLLRDASIARGEGFVALRALLAGL
jgi:hypothetical protein